MTRHSKNCTAHTVYTYYERQRDAKILGFGTQKIRLGKDSIRPIDCCCLSLQTAKDPVVTPDGYLYDRAVILEYIVTQRTELKRKLKLYEKQKLKEESERKEQIKAQKEEDAKRFLAMNTLDTHSQANAQVVEAEALVGVTKRNNSVNKINCFWGQAISSDSKIERNLLTEPDNVIRCPMSGKPIKYKDLVDVKFTRISNDADLVKANSNNSNCDVRYCCAVSNDHLTNATACIVLKTSGSVVTKRVVDSILSKEMVDPINGLKLKSTDFIELKKGSLGFADEHTVLTAKRFCPIMQS